MELSLSGKTALICGSSQGIGLASAIELSSLGADCILVARNEERLQQALGMLNPKGRHRYLTADFDHPEELHGITEPLLRTGPVHILVNNSGGPPGGPLLEASPEAFIIAYKRLLICSQLLSQALIPGMRRAGYGRIINIISTSVKAPIKGLGISNTTRWAVAAWAKTLAGEVAGDRITVNNVLPGSTMTARLKTLLETRAKQLNASYQTVEDQSLAEIPMKRFGEPGEIAAVVAFLASTAATNNTGTSIPVDCGRTPVL
jgi:3-oxoacyl-[acyl-carrier protein] reductase